MLKVYHTAVVEAAFAQIPIVATDVGGTKEILGEYWDTTSMYQLVQAKI